MVARLAERTPLRASLLTGSAAAGSSDEHSDVDLLNYYEELPERQSFEAVLAGLGAERRVEIGTTADGYSASYQLDGIELQTGATLTSAVERRLEQAAAGEVDWTSAKVLEGLLQGLPLHGEELVRRWQARAADYPDALRRREVEVGIAVFPVWLLDGHLAARDAQLFRRQMLLDGAFRVLAVLSALNRIYFSSFQFKRARAHCARMALRPDRLAERLDLVADGPPAEAARELQALVEETKALVRAELPDVDVDARWRPRP